MDAPTLLAAVLAARQPADIFSRATYRTQLHAHLKLLHPDVCALPHAAAATARLNEFAEQLRALDNPTDDAGPLRRVDERTFRFEGTAALLAQSRAGYGRLQRLPGAAAQHFRQYLPVGLDVQPTGHLLATGPGFVVPLSGLVLTPTHVGWVLSRLLEFAAWLHQEGLVHGGFTPESLALVPDTHGLVCWSFYHLTPLGRPLTTASARYLGWYPPAVFRDKKATPYVDVSLAQRTALYLLGDPSGHGVKLKKTVDPRLIDFLLAPHVDAYTTLGEWRLLLTQLFGKRQFHPLIL